MANEYLVNSDDLTAVADAIRTKGGTSDALTFPGGFVDAVGAIQAGEGGNGIVESDGVISGMTLFAIKSDTATKITGNFHYNEYLAEIDCPNVKSIGNSMGFAYCKNLARVNLPLVEYIISSGFKETPALLEYDFSNVRFIYQFGFCASGIKKVVSESITYINDQRTFDSCKNLTYVNLPNVQKTGWQWNFCNCPSLKKAVFANATEIGSGEFNNDPLLETLVLGSKTVVKLNNANAFVGTPIESGAGYVYVPRTLEDGSDGVTAYQAATNWSTYATQFRAIEDYPGIEEDDTE